MTSSIDFTRGLDLDPDHDALNTEVVFADSSANAFPADSGDDDGYVDLVFVVTRSAPTGFIISEADGITARLANESPRFRYWEGT